MDALWSFRNYDSGQIVGTGIHNGLMGAFLLTRCAERCSAHLGAPRFTERLSDLIGFSKSSRTVGRNAMRPLFGAQTRQGFFERFFGRGASFCRDLKRCSHGAEEAPHLRDVWHYLALVDPSLKLAHQRVTLRHRLVQG